MLENIKKMFKKEETVEQKIAREIKEEHKKLEKRSKPRIARQ